MVNPLDPTSPTLTDPSIELTAELRSMKQRLVTDKTNIEQLQSTLVSISSITPFGADLIATADYDAALTLLAFSAIGKTISQTPDYPTLATALGVQSPVPVLSVGINKWCISLPGTIKINIVVLPSCPSAGTDITWQVPFATSVFGGVASMYNSSATQSAWTRDVTTAGCFVDHGNASSESVCVIMFGQ